jgi:hypothetical protein
MGKPLGLGSVKITSKLYISNRKERYSSLFAELNDLNESGINQYIEKFQGFIKNEIKSKEDFWEIDRLKELKILLDYKHGCKLENETNEIDVGKNCEKKIIKKKKTEYMTIGKENEFKKRPVLPKASKV